MRIKPVDHFSKAKKSSSESTRLKRFMRLGFVATAVLASSVAHAGGSSFVGSGGGAIPDDNPTGVTINFEVTGQTLAVQDVTINLDITHTFLGDLTATLFSPGDLASLKLFGRVGSTRTSGFGDSSNLAGVYTFTDFGANDLWAVAATGTDATNIATGMYRTTTGGTGTVALAQRTNVGGCSSYLQLAFGGLQGSQLNGTWRLVITDAVASDVGTVNAATSSIGFSLGAAPPELPMFRAGFENTEPASSPNPIAPIGASNVRGSCTPGINSPTGSGLTDFVMARAVASNIEWRIKKNDATAAGPDLTPFVFGKDTDFFMMGDFDGDGLSDPVIWTTGTQGRFKVRRSSRPTDAPLELFLGQSGDDSTVIGDYDGDRVTDFAVFRPGTAESPAGKFLIRKSSSGVVSDFPISSVVSSSAFAFHVGDINLDGLADFGVQTNNAGAGGFRMFSGFNGVQIANFDFGLTTDFIVPGQFVGSATPDIAVSRNANPGTGTVKYAFPRDMATGMGDATTLATGIVFGISGDFITQGDYDGDGITDFAVWRSNATAGQSKFILRRSTNIAMPLEVFIGAAGDYPVNNWDVH